MPYSSMLLPSAVGGDRFEGYFVAQGFQPVNESTLDRLTVPFVEVMASQVLKGGFALNQMVCADEDAVTDCDRCLRLAPSGCQPMVLGRKVGVLSATGGLGCFDQGRAQPTVSLARGPL